MIKIRAYFQGPVGFQLFSNAVPSSKAFTIGDRKCEIVSVISTSFSGAGANRDRFKNAVHIACLSARSENSLVKAGGSDSNLVFRWLKVF